MKVLVLGGTGLISVGIVKHLLARKLDVTVFNRGQRESMPPAGVKALVGDRNGPEFGRIFDDVKYDCVIDMICFQPNQASAAIAAAGGKCGHYIFCSTVCTYGIKSPPNVLIDETFSQEPLSGYGRDKVACEKLFMQAHDQGKFQVTIIRPSHTYGPGHPLIDQLEFDSMAWDRISRGLPVLCGGDGLGLWVSTHRDDCGKLFAYAADNARTFGQSYNATRAEHTTWRDYYRQVAEVLGQPAKLIFMPTDWIVKHDPKRFGLLREITAFHGAYDSSKAMTAVEEFRCPITLKEGALEVFTDQKSRGKWRDSSNDPLYQQMVEEAMRMGMEAVEA